MFRLSQATVKTFLNWIKNIRSKEDLLKFCEDEVDNSGFAFERLADLSILFDREAQLLDGVFGTFLYPVTDILKYLDGLIISGNTGGKSDISYIKGGTFYMCSVKHYKDLKADKSEVQHLVTVYEQLNEHTSVPYTNHRFVLYTKDKNEFLSKNSNRQIKTLGRNCEIRDATDIFKSLRPILNHFRIRGIDDYLKMFISDKPLLSLRPHQIMASNFIIESNYSVTALDLHCRGGKSYIVADVINRKKNGNFMIILNFPTETTNGFYTMLKKYENFSHFNIKTNYESVCNNDQNVIYLFSKQTLQLKDLKIFPHLEYVFIDEAHYATGTNTMIKILSTISHEKRVLVSGTLDNAIKHYGLTDDQIFSWVWADSWGCTSWCKINQKLIPQEIVDNYGGIDEVNNCYDQFPRLTVLTEQFNPKYIKEMNEDNLGFDFSKLFAFKKNENKSYFANPGKVEQIIGFVHRSLERILEIEEKHESKDQHVCLMYIPCGGIGSNIGVLSKLLQNKMRMSRTGLSEVWHIKALGNETKYKSFIDTQKRISRKNLLILTGQKISLGFTHSDINIVFFLNNSKSVSMTIQRLSRCLTERKDKRSYVIHGNPNETIEMCLDITSSPKLNKNSKNSTFLRMTRMINFDTREMFTQKNLANELFSFYADNQMLLKGKFINGIVNIIDLVNIELIEPAIVKALYFFGKRNKKIIVMKKGQLNRGKLSKKDNSVDDDNSDDNSVDDSVDDDNSDDNIEINTEAIRSILYECFRILFILNYDKITSLEIDICSIEQKTYVLINNYMGGHADFINFIREYILKNLKLDTTIYLKGKHMISMMKNKKEILSFLEEHLTPNKERIQQFGDVPTPINTIEEMLDMLPLNVWSNKDLTWLDPCVGMGNFIVCVYYRLMDGLNKVIPDDKKRDKYIRSNMLYASELNHIHIKTFQKLLPIDNLIEGNFLEIDVLDNFGMDKKFDIILGNPPYNGPSNKKKGGNSKTGSGHSIYTKFILKSLDLANNVLMIIPSRWTVGSTTRLKPFLKEMIKRERIQTIRIIKNPFEVQIENPCYLLCNEKSSICEIITDTITYSLDLKKTDMILTPLASSIINKIEELSSGTRSNKNLVNARRLLDELTTYPYLDGRCFPRSTYNNCIESGLQSSTKLNQEGKYNDILCYVKEKEGMYGYINIDDFKGNLYNYYKVLTTKASGGGSFGNLLIARADEIFCETYIGFYVSSFKEGISMITYLRTKFANYLLSLKKITQDVTPDKCYFIPFVPLDREWNDQKLFDHFNLNTDEQKTILSHKDTPKLKPMYQGSIKNITIEELKSLPRKELELIAEEEGHEEYHDISTNTLILTIKINAD
jgi:hypothetical protein